MAERIAVFPLPTVLLPGEVIPLHIFEPRYKLLVQRVLDGRERMGINLLWQGRFYGVGCVSALREVFRRYRDGRMDIAVEGVQRYQTLSLDERTHPYWTAEVEWLLDEEDTAPDELRQACVELYARFLQLLRGTTPDVEELILADSRQAEPLSFFIGRQLGLEVLQRQHLLELRSERQRLEWLRAHLERLLPRLEQLELFVRRVRSNGHFR
ncbi:MAG: LON peptidase substrate-binding domain-containing protein [Candidatus Kapabacteria bacterium]|nr:LON peptidase substrate-binding domain-containing protein [Candidatus Kapabacteria bacterium]MDW8012965.1 LON peptidase substrate-binding domain-containing protein [Bacteroidota bacterium]